MRSAEIRSAFLRYFEERQHTVVDSSSLVPVNDQTLLFTNAGMVQFKDALAFREDRGYTRAASCQRCVRAGGKHNDLDNVGYTTRHHTFFEMLGNFSFGDYFKRDAIFFAWDFLTKVIGLPAERLWVTVHETDDESVDIWVKEVGFDPARISRLGDDDNFWTMGDTGPCGASSEIFYDHGPEVQGGPPGSEDGELDRYVEIWNLVFTQFDRSADGTLTPLTKPCVDTGLGLERLAAVLQGVHSNYDIDLFQNLIAAARRLIGLDGDVKNPSLNVIADHIRSAAFLIMDGVLPSNEGRGYVLRRIIRRALRHGHKLGASEPFFAQLVEPLVAEMGEAYPELAELKEQIASALAREEDQFARTLDQGMRLLVQAMDEVKDGQIPGDMAFTLHDRYGFPVDLTEDVARERGLAVDIDGYDRAMAVQKQQSREAGSFKSGAESGPEIEEASEFVGYAGLSASARITAIVSGDVTVDAAPDGAEVALVLDATPFYAESGGQVGDRGIITAGDIVFEVTDTQRSRDAILHFGRVRGGELSVGGLVKADVDADLRQATRLNHSATHLLHAALRDVLGSHVQQRGSRVDAEHLRFDFAHFDPVTPEQQRNIERLVNREIIRNTPIETELMTVDAARERGAMALFGEKYSHEVRVLTMGDGFSMELCGGTHAGRTGDIGLLRITSQQGISSGVRRIEAVTGTHALAWVEKIEDRLAGSVELLKTDGDGLTQRIEALLDDNRRLEKEVSALNVKLASGGGGSSDDDPELIHGVPVVVKQIDGASPASLPEAMDQIKGRLKSAVVLLAAVNGDKISLVAGVTKDLTARIDAPALLNHVAGQVGGKGGGRPDLARGGGSDIAALDGALSSVSAFLEERLT